MYVIVFELMKKSENWGDLVTQELIEDGLIGDFKTRFISVTIRANECG